LVWVSRPWQETFKQPGDDAQAYCRYKRKKNKTDQLADSPPANGQNNEEPKEQPGNAAHGQVNRETI
jgi:hypothetical protein